MIQRIQTVYLFFVFCLMVILEFAPFSPSLAISSNAGLIAVLALITIFLYKNRNLQIKICYLLQFLLGIIYVIYFIFEWQGLPFAELFRNIRFTFVFPFISFILVYLAIRGIRKDDKLVRSLARLR